MGLIARSLFAALAAALLFTPSALASSSAALFFELPSKNIVCVYVAAPGSAGALQCGIGSGLVPPAPKPVSRCIDTDPASDRVELALTGRTHGFCSGDIGVLAELGRAPVLPYGSTWRHGGFVCTSARTGLTCKNPSGHGFFLSRQRWHAF